MGSSVPTPAATGGDDWDAHWSEFSDANANNPAQAFRRRLVLRELTRYGQPQRLLDVGSGNGELLGAAAARWPQAELLGLELSHAGVARTHETVPGARARVCDLLAEPEPAAGELGWATDAVCSEVLEHVDDPVALLRNARAWLGSGARLVVTVPGGPMSAFDHHIGHRRHFTPADLAAVISAAGLEVVTVGGAGFPFFNVYRLLVISRGEQLIDAARNQQGGNSQSALLRAGQAAFDPLFRLTLPRSRLGWQTVGVARNR